MDLLRSGLVSCGGRRRTCTDEAQVVGNRRATILTTRYPVVERKP